MRVEGMGEGREGGRGGDTNLIFIFAKVGKVT